MKTIKKIMIIMLAVTGVMFAKAVSAQQVGSERSEVSDTLMAHVELKPWYRVYFESFTDEQLHDDSVKFPFFTGHKFILYINKRQVVTSKGVVLVCDKDHVPSKTRLVYDKTVYDRRTGRTIYYFTTPSGVEVPYVLQRNGQLSYNDGNDTSIVMWYVGTKNNELQEQKE